MAFPLPELTLQRDLLLGFRFGVFFFAAGVVPNPLDIRFQRVKGLSASVTTKPLTEGGQNLYTQKLPVGIEHGNLVLERGMVVGSPLNVEFNAAISLFKFLPSNVLVTLFNEASVPVSAWMFMKAFPVKWSTSDLDATEKSVVIDTLELAYAQMMIMRI
ncbi:MAG TPA: phage tail protein [Polyangiaceae bacterium]|nr:phage tail protein [Polyangiaceae bacterium]